MKIITTGHPGLQPLPDTLERGMVAVFDLSRTYPRLQVPRLQLHTLEGGSGMKPDTLGTGVYMLPLYREWPPGSGTIATCPRELASDYEFKGRRTDLLGLASPELQAELHADTTEGQPGDKYDMRVLVATAGEFAKAETVKACLKKLGKSKLGTLPVFVVQRESYVNDFGFICCPTWAVVEGRPVAQPVSGHEGMTRTLDAAEAYAAQLIAAARQPA